MMRALLDTNVILDYFLARQPFDTEALAIWRANERGQFAGYISGITAVNFFMSRARQLGMNERDRQSRNFSRQCKSRSLMMRYYKWHIHSNGPTMKTQFNMRARRRTGWRRL